MSSTPADSKPRRSIFGSLKKLASRKSTTNMGNPAEAITGNNPLSTPAPPTRRPASDAPPSYMDALSGPAVPVPGSGSGGRSVSPAPSHLSTLSIGNTPLQTEEDPYAFLTTFDTIFLVDDSGSMAGASWRECRDVLKSIAPICAAHDADGVDVYFLNSLNIVTDENLAGGFLHIKSADTVNALFNTVRPSGQTPIGTRLRHLLTPYINHFEWLLKEHKGDAEATGLKPVNIIVITDGVPSDDPEAVILQAAKRLDKLDAPPYQVGIQFFQVGNEAGAREALMDMDDNLGKEAGAGVRDIVDTTTWDGIGSGRPVLTKDGILKAVLGAVVKRLDRKRVSVDQQRRDRLRP